MIKYIIYNCNNPTITGKIHESCLHKCGHFADDEQSQLQSSQKARNVLLQMVHAELLPVITY